MSDAKVAIQDVFSINVCSQCRKAFEKPGLRGARHAVPCGHVFCTDCLGRAEAEQKLGTPVCRTRGCSKRLALVAEFPVAWCVRRTERINTEVATMLGDQGDFGDVPEVLASAEASPPPSGCAEHKLDGASAALDSSCSATSIEVSRQIARLAAPFFTPEELCARLARWSAEETARIRAWEKREVQHVQAVAEECVTHVQQACAQRMEVGASVFTQRTSLRVSLEELEQALSVPAADAGSQSGKKQTARMERKRLCELLASNKLAVPPVGAVLRWARLPDLSDQFGQDRSAGGPSVATPSSSLGVLAGEILSGAKHTLSMARSCRPPANFLPPKAWHEFPVIPALVSEWVWGVRRATLHPSSLCTRLFRSANPPLSVSRLAAQDPAKGMRALGPAPSAYAAVDEDTVVLGFSAPERLQVWDLSAGGLVDELDYEGSGCRSIVALPGGLIAVASRRASGATLSIVDVNAGQPLQELTGFPGDFIGLAFVEDCLLSVSTDKLLIVWEQSPEGKVCAFAFAWKGDLFCPGCVSALTVPRHPALFFPKFAEQRRFETVGRPHSSVTVLSGSTVAVSVEYPFQIEIWDWKAGRQVRELACSQCRVPSHAMLADGQFVTCDESGTIREGRLDYWIAATVTSSSAGFTGVVAGRDGSFVTTDFSGQIKLWRDGACEVALTSSAGYLVRAPAVIGGRLVFCDFLRGLIVCG